MGALVIKAILFGTCISATDFSKLPYLDFVYSVLLCALRFRCPNSATFGLRVCGATAKAGLPERSGLGKRILPGQEIVMSRYLEVQGSYKLLLIVPAAQL